MPDSLSVTRFHWGWSELSEGERDVARHHQALLDSHSNHTFQSFRDQFAEIARQLPNRSVFALTDAGHDPHQLVLHVAHPDGTREELDLSYWTDDDKGRRKLAYQSEPDRVLCRADRLVRIANQLNFEGFEDEAKAIDYDQRLVTLPDEFGTKRQAERVLEVVSQGIEASCEYVAIIDGDPFRCAVSPDEVVIDGAALGLESGAHAEILADILAPGHELFPEPVNAALFKAAGIDTVEVALYWPRSVLDEIAGEASRCDRSISWTVQTAWKHSLSQMMAVDSRQAAKDLRGEWATGDDRVRQSVYLPVDMLADIESLAERLESSKSFVVQVAWRVGRAAVADHPTAE